MQTLRIRISVATLVLSVAGCSSGPQITTLSSGEQVNFGQTDLPHPRGKQTLFQFFTPTPDLDRRIDLARSAVASRRGCEWVPVGREEIARLTARQATRNAPLFLVAVTRGRCSA